MKIISSILFVLTCFRCIHHWLFHNFDIILLFFLFLNFVFSFTFICFYEYIVITEIWFGSSYEMLFFFVNFPLSNKQFYTEKNINIWSLTSMLLDIYLIHDIYVVRESSGMMNLIITIFWNNVSNFQYKSVCLPTEILLPTNLVWFHSRELRYDWFFFYFKIFNFLVCQNCESFFHFFCWSFSFFSK